MAAIKALFKIIFLSMVFFLFVFSIAIYSEFRDVSKSVEKDFRERLKGTAFFVREFLESGSLKYDDAYSLYALAKKHKIQRIVIFDNNSKVINDTLSTDSPPSWLNISQIRDIIQGREEYLALRDKDGGGFGMFAVPVSSGDKAFALAVLLQSPYRQTLQINALTALFIFFVIFPLMIYMIMKIYLKARKKEMQAEKEDLSQVGFVVGTFHDMVTRLKEQGRELEMLKEKAEKRAESIESYNENILQSVPSGVISFNEDMKITSFNTSAGRILNLRPEDAVGRHYLDIFVEPISKLLETKEPVERAELSYKTSEGKKIWLGLTLSPLMDSRENKIGQILVFTDLTELRNLELQAELRRRLSSLGELSAGIAHELRNPMAVIAGYTKLLKKKVDHPLVPTVDAISKEVSAMNRIITDFLSFAKPSELNLSPLNLYAVISSCIKNTVTEGIRTQTDVDDSLVISGDEILIRQAFTNLIQNAVDTMEDGGILSVRTRLVKSEHLPLNSNKPDAARLPLITERPYAEISFSDTGRGIPEAIRDKIFLPFYTTKEKGTGLGLAIVHKIVVLHDGFINVQTSEEGTTFTIKLPLHP